MTTVDIAGEYGDPNGGIFILDDDGNELVMWDSAEWIEDPSLVFIIVNAVVRGGVPGGPLLPGYTEPGDTEPGDEADEAFAASFVADLFNERGSA